MGKRKANLPLDAGLDSRKAILGVELLEAPANLTEGIVADQPTGAGSPSGVITNQKTTNTEYVAEGANMGHSPFRLLLKQAGYEVW